MYWKDIWWLMECPGRLENKAQKLMRTCGKLGSWNQIKGRKLLACITAATPSRMSSELSLLFCATHSRGKAQAEHLVVSVGHMPIFSLLEVLKSGSGGDSFPSGKWNSASHQDSMPGTRNRRTSAHARWTSVHHRSWTPFSSPDWDNWAVLDMGGGDGASPLATENIHILILIFLDV